MATRRDRNSVDAEIHRIKNRVRQQRYRARKREEKAKRDGENILPSRLFITGFLNTTNGSLASTPDESFSNTNNVGARDGTRSSDVDHGDTYREETDSSQFKPIVRWQHKQQCNVESVGTAAEVDTAIAPENYRTFHSHRSQPLCQMENELTMNNLNMQEGYAMKPLDQSERRRSDEEIMTRRLKNRERQRRYRARKRLEAETNKQSIPLPVVAQPSGGIITERVSRIHCERDWKEDARKAHLSKVPEILPALNLIPENDKKTINSISENNNNKPITEDELHAENQVVSWNNSESSTSPTFGRRDWKTAARNKVD